jgi:hypothetical protein
VLTVKQAIIVDAWWNEAIESQAFGRIFRIGQEKGTSLTRLFITDTIDEKIHQMQREKKAKIQQVMERGDDHKAETVEDLLNLFGNVDQAENRNGQYFVLGEDRPAQEAIFDDNAYMEWDQMKK